MSDILTFATLQYGSTLCADVTIVGSYLAEHPTRKRDLERPIYDVNRLFIRDAGRVQKTRKTSGVVRARFGGDVLRKAGQLFEYRDDKESLKEYTLTTSERTALRSLSKNGLPPDMQIQWDRLVRGPMSPTLEQEVYRTTGSGTADGGTYTITNPTSGNLLVLCHGYYWRGASPGEPASTGFTRRGYAGTANFEVLQAILDKTATGSEGTSITCTNGGTVENNSGGFLEYSGMVSSAFVAISAGADGGSGDVTSVGTGNVDTDTPNKPDCLLIATFGHDGLPTSWGYTNSFTEEGSIVDGAGGSNHGTRIATRVVSAESATYNTTASWTTGVVAAGIVAAYAITTTSPPVVTIPTTYVATNNLGPRTISGVSVAAGDDPITLVTLACTSGKGTMTMTASGSSSVSGNGTNAISVIGGSETDINNTLATLAWTGLEPTREKVTVTVLATDDTFSDSEGMVLFNHMTSLTVVADSYADLVAAIQTVKMILPLSVTEDTVTISVEDEDELPDQQVIRLFVPLPAGDGDLPLIASTRGLTDVIL